MCLFPTRFTPVPAASSAVLRLGLTIFDQAQYAAIRETAEPESFYFPRRWKVVENEEFIYQDITLLNLHK